MNNATEMKLVTEPKIARKYINEKYNIKDNELVFIFVGRINTLKNIFFIVDSLKLLKTKKPRLKFKMLFVGSGQDEEKLKQKISELDMEIDRCVDEAESILAAIGDYDEKSMPTNYIRLEERAKVLGEVKNDLQSRLEELV